MTSLNQLNDVGQSPESRANIRLLTPLILFDNNIYTKGAIWKVQNASIRWKLKVSLLFLLLVSSGLLILDCR